MSLTRKLKAKKCRQCPELFMPWNSTQVCCSPECALIYIKHKQETKLRRAIKTSEMVKRKEIRQRKEKLKSRSEWLAEAQIIFNKFIRLRDKDEPCISCGRYDHEIDYIGVGGKWDCGHWKTRGAFPELRFNEFNAHKQCKSCNGGAGKYTKKNHTVAQSYKLNLIEKIGQKNVDILESKHEQLKLSIDDIKAIKTKYRDKIKELT